MVGGQIVSPPAMVRAHVFPMAPSLNDMTKHKRRRACSSEDFVTRQRVIVNSFMYTPLSLVGMSLFLMCWWSSRDSFDPIRAAAIDSNTYYHI